jgi:SAM-dependent methyltransferase
VFDNTCLLTTVDNNPAHFPDKIIDLNYLDWPLESSFFDEVHAYEVLEHLGRQGDVGSFFNTFYEIWRVLKPGGILAATVPRWDSMWAWGDPSHTRVISLGSLVFLSQAEYKKQVGKTAMSDFRHMWKGNFEYVWSRDNGEIFEFKLRAVKS